MIFIIILALTFVPVPALGHSFYPKDCCSDADCAVLASSRVQVTRAGYVIDGRETIPHNKALFSPDEHYHGCFPKAMMGKVGCFWAPQRAY
jgi:hypothetical protein